MKVNLCLPYYNNLEMLKFQLRTWWLEYPDDLREKFRFIIVDDCSKESPEREVRGIVPVLDVQLYRMQKDIPWGWPAAKNVAMLHVPEDEVALLTDIDHVLEPSDAAELVRMEVASDAHYVPRRRLASDRSEYKRHPATYIMRRSLYWKIGGFEERWIGTYGSDHMMWRRACRLSRRVDLDDLWLTLYSREDIADANSDLGRKQSKYWRSDAVARQQIKAARGPVQVVLSQPYERIL